MPELRQDLHGAIPAERTAPPLSLYDADSQIVEMFLLRTECESDDERAELDKPLKAYVETELEKVTPLAALVTCFTNNATNGRADEERIQKDRARWNGSLTLLKGWVYDSMVARGKQLIVSAAVRFRLQDNQVQPKVTDLKLIPEKYLLVNVTMPFTEYKRMTADLHDYGRWRAKEGVVIEPLAYRGDPVQIVDTQALKLALQANVRCPECAKKKVVPATCDTCKGTGLVPAKVPGAELQRTQHLRIE